MDIVLGLCVGVGLSAACGFRVFLPLLATGLATRAGHLQVAEGMQWLGSDVALVTFGVATVLEIGAYYIPWLDNLFDTLAAPAAVIAGTVVTASCVVDMSPFLQWTLALIAGGGAAGMMQAATSVTRAASTGSTLGLANPVFSTVEAGVSTALSVLALLAPVVGVFVLMLLVGGIITWILRRGDRAVTSG